MLRIGEETGRLDQALAFLAEYYGKRIAQRRIVYGAISYPLIILFTAICSCVYGPCDCADVRAGVFTYGW